MSIISFEFFCFVAAAVLFYYLCPLKMRWVVLFVASAAFVLIGTGQVGMYLVFVLMTLLAWGAAILIARARNEKRKDLITASAIVILAVLLILAKDISFFINNGNRIARLFGIGLVLRMPEWTAPFGMSYFTLILIGYVLDVRWGVIREPQRNPLKMLAFSGYFPHLTSGPFTRYNDISEYLYNGNRFDYENFCFGLQRFVWGLFKKLVIADRVAPIVAAMYDAQPSLLTVIVGGWLYVLQLYADFSGCMDIVIGCSQLFGIPLAENFNTPFYSLSLSEWWRRWHITLGVWLKDYLMYPLQKKLTSILGGRLKKHFGKKAGKDIVLYLSTLVLWFTVGFWHGGSWKYICASGLLFWILITGGMILKPVFTKIADFLHLNQNCWSWTMFQRIRTFLLFSLVVSLGRTNSLREGLRRFVEGATHWRLLQDYSNLIAWFRSDTRENAVLLLILAFSLGVQLTVSVLHYHYGDCRKLLAKQNLVFRWIVLIALLFFVLLAGIYGPEYVAQDFIYEQF